MPWSSNGAVRLGSCHCHRLLESLRREKCMKICASHLARRTCAPRARRGRGPRQRRRRGSGPVRLHPRPGPATPTMPVCSRSVDCETGATENLIQFSREGMRYQGRAGRSEPWSTTERWLCRQRGVYHLDNNGRLRRMQRTQCLSINECILLDVFRGRSTFRRVIRFLCGGHVRLEYVWASADADRSVLSDHTLLLPC